MFQNINVDEEVLEDEVKPTKMNKKELLKEILKVQNVIVYILAFRCSADRVWRAELHHLLWPF